MRVTSNFAKKVLEYRTKNNLSQGDVASKANSSQSVISKIETALDEGRRIIISNKTYNSVANLLKQHQGDPTPLGVEKRETVASQKIYIITDEIERLNFTLIRLEECLPGILNQSFWHRKITIEEKARYISCIGEIKAKLVREIAKTYPSLRGKNIKIYPTSREIHSS